MPAKPGFYAVRAGRIPGVYSKWDDCEAQTKGFNGARYKKFSSLQEAEVFVSGNTSSAPPGASSTQATSFSDSKGKKRAFDEIEDETTWDVVFSDGACKGNGKVGSYAGVGVWWGNDDPRNIAERCPGDQTNNRAELIAILRVLETAPITGKPLLIKTDSQYSIQCFQDWIHKWMNSGWKTTSGGTIKNEGIIRCIYTQLEIRGKCGQKIRLQYVKGHSGNVGNDGADSMANYGALKPKIPDRDWESLRKELEQRLEMIDVVGEGVALEVSSSDEESPEVFPPSRPDGPSRKVENGRSISPTELATKSSSTLVRSTATQSPTKVRKVGKGESVHTSSVAQGSFKPVMKPPSDVLAVVQRVEENAKNVPLAQIMAIPPPEKSPVRVIFAGPPLVPVPVEDVNFDDYKDCVLDDEDLANELLE